MGNSFTLDSLKEEVEKEFAPLKIELNDGTVVTIKNLLRLPKTARDTVMAKLKDLQEHDAKSAEGDVSSDELDTLIEAATEILTLASDNGRKLVKEMGGDLALIMKVLERWMGSTQPGEAQPSSA